MSSLDAVNYIPIEKLIADPYNFSVDKLKPILDKTAKTYPASLPSIQPGIDSSRYLIYTKILYRTHSVIYKALSPTYTQEEIDKTIIEDAIDKSPLGLRPFFPLFHNSDTTSPTFKIKGFYMMNGCVVGIKTGHSQYFNLLWGKSVEYKRSFLKIYTAINNLEEEITSKTNTSRNVLNTIASYINKLK